MVIDSIAALVKLVDDWDAKFSEPGLGYLWGWFRGQADESWELLPGVLRKDFLEASLLGSPQFEGVPSELMREMTLNKYFRVLGASYFPSGCSPVDVYLLAQHHGLPTRLLDWTTNPLAALYFAVSGGEKHSEKDGAIFVVNPKVYICEQLPNFYSQENFAAANIPIAPWLWPQALPIPNPPKEVASVDHPFVAWIITSLLGDNPPMTTSMVLPLLPDRRAGRIFQQSSCFTLHTPGATGASHSTLEKYLVPKEAKPTLLLQLRRLNITCATLFGDLDNVAKEMKSAFRLS